MTFYIHYNKIVSQTGVITNQFAGFYDSAIHSTIPSNSVEITNDQYVQFYQQISNSEPVLAGGITIMAVPPIATPLTWDDIRRTRDALLAESDWTDSLSAKTRLGDTLYNKWQLYRQALRDLPSMYSDPSHVVWPTPADFGI